MTFTDRERLDNLELRVGAIQYELQSFKNSIDAKMNHLESMLRQLIISLQSNQESGFIINQQHDKPMHQESGSTDHVPRTLQPPENLTNQNPPPQLWELDISTLVTLKATARAVSDDSLLLGLSKGTRLSHPKQVKFFHRFMATLLIPTFSSFCYTYDGGGLSEFTANTRKQKLHFNLEDKVCLEKEGIDKVDTREADDQSDKIAEEVAGQDKDEILPYS